MLNVEKAVTVRELSMPNPKSTHSLLPRFQITLVNSLWP